MTAPASETRIDCRAASDELQLATYERSTIFMSGIESTIRPSVRRISTESCRGNRIFAHASKRFCMPMSRPSAFLNSRLRIATMDISTCAITEVPGDTSSAPTSCCSKSAKAAWASCSWPSRPSRSSGRWR